jgi:hypothetical protein
MNPEPYEIAETPIVMRGKKPCRAKNKEKKMLHMIYRSSA